VRTSRSDSPAGTGDRERGSAILVVFLFAAMVAIFLYRELPIVVMEAQRQKEQTLIDRASQYQRAIQVFYRARHTYPPSIDALENTNNLRFLRRRYKDPMTGKDDWRLLHMGPAGVVDSLVNPLTTTGQGGSTQGGFGQTATGQDGFGQQSGFGQQNGFGQGANSATNSNSTQPQSVVLNAADPSQGGQNGDNALAEAQSLRRHRAPAVASNAQQDPNAPEAQNAQFPSNAGEPGANEPSQAGDTASLGGANGPGQQSAGSDPNAQGNANGSPNANGTPNSNAALANQIMRNPATSPAAPASSTQQLGSSANPNPISGGSIAGVATKVHGKAIKVFNDQKDYAKWEFVYDFRKDTGTISGTNPQGAGGTVPLSPGQNGLSGSSTTSSFGQSSSSFGQSGSSFGQSSSQNGTNQTSPPANSNANQQNPNPNQ
jgi:hypothetical protein